MAFNQGLLIVEGLLKPSRGVERVNCDFLNCLLGVLSLRLKRDEGARVKRLSCSLNYLLDCFMREEGLVVSTTRALRCDLNAMTQVAASGSNA